MRYKKTNPYDMIGPIEYWIQWEEKYRHLTITQYQKAIKKLLKMYKYKKPKKTSIKRNTGYQGETLEKKVDRIVNNKEPIKDGSPIMYTERKEGVLPATNIRTDRFEVALDAMDAVSQAHTAKREERHKPKEKLEADGSKPPTPSNESQA